MKKTSQLLCLRYKMIYNYIYEQLRNWPILVSFIIILPIIIFIILELSISNSFSSYAINSNLYELYKSFNVFVHQLIYYVSLIMVPIYIFISQLNIKSYNRYKTLHLSFREISLANIYGFLTLLDIMLFVFISLVLFKTSSTISSSITFLLLFLITLDIFILFLFLLCQILSHYLRKLDKRLNSLLIETTSAIICSLCIFIPIKYVPFSFVMNLSTTIIFLYLIVLLSIVYNLYKRLKIGTNIILQKNFSVNMNIKIRGDLSIPKNYLLMIFSLRKIYFEYILTIIFLFFILKIADMLSSTTEILYQLIMLMFLISNGVIYSYKKWYILHPKDAFKKILIIDFFASIIILFCSIMCLTFCLRITMSINRIFLIILIYFINVFIQNFIKLEYHNNSKAPIIFILFYGTISYISFSAIDLVMSYV